MCPELSRVHKTRCDKYFRCVELPSKSYVWIPTQCDRGLIFEPSLKACVLPGENWECNLNDAEASTNDDKNVYGVNNIPLGDYNDHTSGEEDMISVGDSDSTPIIISDSDGGLDILNGDSGVSDLESKSMMNEDDFENYSGDSEITIENKASTDISIPSSDDVGNSLKSHLQRLSQLIDNMKNRHDNKSTLDDMHADELNAYLSSHNLLTTPPYQVNNYDSPYKFEVPKNGHIDPEFVNQIIKEQNKIGFDDVMRSTVEGMKATTPMPTFTEKPTNTTLIFPLKSPNVKLHFKSESPLKNYRHPDYPSSSHIIVNRPGGSVLFNVDSNNNNNRHHLPDYSALNRNEPYISEDTLKTVLELSKQLIENQNIRHVYPQPIMKPVYYSIPIPVISKYFQNDEDDEPTVEINQLNPNMSVSGFINNLPIRHKLRPNGGSIPITVTNSFNTYKDYEKQTQPLHGPQNNISTTLIFDRNYNYEKTENGPVPQIQTTTQRIVTPTSAPLHLSNDQMIGNQQQLKNAFYQNQNTNYPHFYSQYQPRPQLNNQNYYYPSQDHQTNHDIGYQPPSGLGGYQNPSVIYNNVPTQWGQYNSPNQPYQSPKPQQNYPQPFNGHSSSAQPIQTYQNPPQLPPINYGNQNSHPAYNYGQQNQQNMMNGDVQNDDDDDVLLNNDFENNANNQRPVVMTSLSSNKLNQNKFDSYVMKQKLSSSLMSQFSDEMNDGIDDHNKLVSIGGSYISYDKYKNSLLPLLQSTSGSDIEIITCSSGVRQPNATDCTKYYVCNPRNRNVLPYSCPPYTGFNKASKICDAKTYAFCKPEAIINRYTVAENMKVHQEAQLALEEAKRIRIEAIRAQSVANIIRMQSHDIIMNDRFPAYDKVEPLLMTTTTTSPPMTTKKRRIRCFDTGKIADPDSVYNYWVCFRGKDNRMKRQKMSCSTGLLFCEPMRLCTVPVRCKN